jgi:hypothetical protein
MMLVSLHWGDILVSHWEAQLSTDVPLPVAEVCNVSFTSCLARCCYINGMMSVSLSMLLLYSFDLFFCVVLGLKLRVSHLLHRYFTTGATLPALLLYCLPLGFLFFVLPASHSINDENHK